MKTWPGKSLKPLSPRQEKFCQEFVRTGNARKSAVACGCTEISAGGYANHALKLPNVQQYLQELRAEQRKASLLAGIDFQLVLQTAAQVDTGLFFEKGEPCESCGRSRHSAIPIPDLPEEVRRVIQAFKVTKRGGDADGKRELILTYDYTLIPKAVALELLGKSQGAFTDKQVVEKTTRFELIIERLRKNVGKARLPSASRHKALPPANSVDIEAREAS